MNLATEYLRATNQTLADYAGLCGELANDIQKATPGSQIVSVSGIGVFDTTAWTYHTVVMLDGMIHDAWRKRAMTLEQWLSRFDCDWYRAEELSIDGVEVFEGPASEFVGLDRTNPSPKSPVPLAPALGGHPSRQQISSMSYLLRRRGRHSVNFRTR